MTPIIAVPCDQEHKLPWPPEPGSQELSPGDFFPGGAVAKNLPANAGDTAKGEGKDGAR